MEKVLVNSDKYDGQYVAIKSISDNTVVGAGATPDIALNESIKNGVSSPFLVYISMKGLIHIYHVS